MLRRHVILALVLCGSFAACDATSINVVPTATTMPLTATPIPADLSHVDWSNFTYPNPCAPPSPATVTVVNGVAAIGGQFHFSVSRPLYGDITGDGVPEAVVPYDCVGADDLGTHVFVYSGNASAPHQIGDLPAHSEPQPDIASIYPDQMHIANHQLTLVGLGFTATAAHCCPDLRITNVYNWNGSSLVLASHTVVPMPPS
ncbi:MAG TPA: hypothetical protein VKB76_07010 [Ktedonobacterales bacterium]|nr:hypothetical protein [Ktedonobacterales bacterium]